MYVAVDIFVRRLCARHVSREMWLAGLGFFGICKSSISMHMYMFMWMSMYIFICVYVFMYIHSYVYMYVSVGPPSSVGPNLLSLSEN